MKIIEGDATIETIGGDIIILETGKQLHREVLVKMKKQDLTGPKTPITIGRFADGNLVDQSTVNFSGPGF